MPAVEVVDLVVRFGDFQAVAGVSFAAELGAVTAVLGPNGAGKTTTLETIEGYRRPFSGRVRVLGLDPTDDRRALSPRIGVMLQHDGVYPALSPRRAAHLFARYYDEPADPDQLLRRLDLDDAAGTPYRRLSGGEKRRLALALALVGRPEVVFLDEPTAGVDPEGRRVIRAIVDELRSDGKAVVLTSHDLEEVERVADHVVILDGGHVVLDGAPETLRGKGDDIRFRAPARIDVSALAAHMGVAVSQAAAGEYIVACPPSPTAVAALTSWLAAADVPLGDLRAGHQRLEDVFLRLVDDSDRSTDSSGRNRRGRRGRS